ncbi:hypothetical protein C0995_013887 [Termitomyces sp. Mi166|nr:hypothetical protein C0995_013887 [Termitomyces sp. Mi166\
MSKTPLTITDRLAYKSLSWVISHSSNRSVEEVVIEGARGLLAERSQPPSEAVVSSSEDKNLFLSAVKYSLSRLPDIASTITTKDEIEKSTYGTPIKNLMRIFFARTLLDGSITNSKDWQRKIKLALLDAYKEALRRKCHVLSRCLLDWVGPDLLQSTDEDGKGFLFHCARFGDAEDIRDLVDRGMDFNYHYDSSGWTALHLAAHHGNLDGVVALVERAPALISAKTNDPLSLTALDLTLRTPNTDSIDVVAYLLDHGADPPSNAMHDAVWRTPGLSDRRLTMLKIFLDRGWDRTAKDEFGRMPIDIAWRRGVSDEVVKYLEHYQAVSLRPYHPTTSPTPSEGAP